VRRHSLAAFIEIAAIRRAIRSPAVVPPELVKAAAEVVAPGGPGNGTVANPTPPGLPMPAG